MSTIERMEQTVQLCRDVEILAIAGIRSAHPGYDDRDLARELVRRRYGAELAAALTRIRLDRTAKKIGARATGWRLDAGVFLGVSGSINAGHGRLENQDDGVITGVLRSPGRATRRPLLRLPRFVTHIDEGAIAAVGALYEELGIDGEVLDLMSSWVSHFRRSPRRLTVLGMNRTELDANPDA